MEQLKKVGPYISSVYIVYRDIDLSDFKYPYMTFETVEVETYGKGASFFRMDKTCSLLAEKDFVDTFRKEFSHYAEHILASWVLRSVPNVQ